MKSRGHAITYVMGTEYNKDIIIVVHRTSPGDRTRRYNNKIQYYRRAANRVVYPSQITTITVIVV